MKIKSLTSEIERMNSLKPVDRLEVHILVDNATDSLSSVPKHVELEFSYLHRKGMRVLSGKCICCASHGLSCLITAHHGSANRTLLFDSGPEADTFEQNTQELGIDLNIVEASSSRTGIGITPAEYSAPST